MQLSLLHVKPQDSHSKPRFFSLRLALAGAEMPSFAKADMGPGTCGMIFPSPHDTSNSWETSRAFTEDASSFTVGIWPPRAYPCSFCRREFRSAQALGGHMNVHRRDRARLRHPSPPPSPFGAPLHNQQQMASSSLFQSQKYMGVSPSAAPSLADQELPALYKASSSTLNDSSYIPINFATSIPLCLHQLASEAASSLMQFPLQPCTGSADLHLSLWRPTYMMNSTKLASHKCNTRTPRLKETPTAFSSLASNAMVSSAKKPLAATATPSCRRNAPAIAAEDESPRKKSHTGSSLHSSQKSRSTSQTEDTQFSLVQIDIEDTCRTCSDESRGASSGDVDLELRLGQKPAPS